MKKPCNAITLRRKTRLLSLCLALALFFALHLPQAVFAESNTGGSSTGGNSASGTESASTSAESTPAEGEGAEPAEGESEPEPPKLDGDSLYAPEEKPAAAAVCLVNEDTGLVVYEKNAKEPLAAASLVKMMTCILTMDFVDKFNRNIDTDMVSSDKSWVYDALYGKNASTADIRKGETVSVRELLYATLLPSANEGALLLADYVAGGYMPNFLYQMNTRAKALGCTGTVFVDPNGLAPESVTTARDMTIITRAFMSYPELVDIAATDVYEISQHERHAAPYNIFSTNRLLSQTSPYYKNFPTVGKAIKAGKTGSHGEWQNFASQAVKDGVTYTCVVLHSPNEADTIGATLEPPQARPALVESAKLYDWAFSTLEVSSALDTTHPVTELKVRYSTDSDTVLLLPSDDIKAVLMVGGDPTQLRKSYNLPPWVAAPVKAGTVVGSVELSIGSKPIGTSRLITGRDVDQNPTLFAITNVGEAVTGLYFRVLFVVVLVFAAGYAGLIALAHNSRIRRKKAPAARTRTRAPDARKKLQRTASPRTGQPKKRR